jgi:hypothetical protein
LLIFCFALGSTLFRSGIDTRDEGILAYGADRVMQGQLPHRDFVSLQPPLSFYTAAVMYKLYGTSLLSLRILGFGIYLALPLLIYGIARTMIGPALSLAAALPACVLGIPFFHFIPFAPWQGVAAAAAAVFLYLRAAPKGSSLGGGLAGILTAAAMLCRHDQGLYVALAIVAYTLALRYAGQLIAKELLGRVFAGWIVGIVVCFLPWTIYWAVEGAVPAMFQQLVLYFATTYVKTHTLPFPRFGLDLPLVRNAIVSLFYLPPVAGLLAACWLWRQYLRRCYGLREANMTLVLAWTLLFYCQVRGRTDVHHLLLTQVPFFILSACLWAAALEAGVAKVPFSVAATVALASFLVLVGPFFLQNPGSDREAPLPRTGVRFKGAEELADFVRQVQQYAPPDRSILCLPYQPMLYFLCQRRNPTRWDYLWAGDQTAADFQTLVNEAKHDPPAVVLIADEPWLAHFAPIILDYVHEDYRNSAKILGVSFYLPK